MKFKTLKLLAASAVLALGAQGLHAAPIGSFAFQTFGGFVDGSALCADGTTDCSLNYSNIESEVFLDDTAQAQNINWGTPAFSGGSQSGLRTEHEKGDILTNTGFRVVDTFLHDNFVLAASGGYMSEVEYFSRFVLFDPPADTDPLPPFAGLSDTQSIDFLETINVTSGSCAFDDPAGSVCDDIFEFDPLTATFPFLVRDGYVYTIEFRFTPGANAFVVDGGVVSGNPDKISVFTAEDATSEIFIEAQITSRLVDVPEPGTLALLGMALAGMGVAVRRRRLQ